MSREALRHLDMIHRDRADGYITIMQFDENGKIAKMYNDTYGELAKVIGEFEGEKDVYITPNSFYIPRRNSGNIRQFRSLYVDLDIEKKTNYDVMEAYYELFELVNMEKLPQPTMVVHSGRGLHVYWSIQDAPKQAVYLWQEIEDLFCYRLESLGADHAVRDSARILRLPGSINGRNGKECKIIYVNEANRYSLYELRDMYLPQKKKISREVKSKKTKTQKGGVKQFPFSSYSLHYSRLQDIQDICAIRAWDVEGYRNTLVMLYAYWTGIYNRDPKTLEEMVLEFNSKFKVPLPEPQVKSILKSVQRSVDKFVAYEQAVKEGLRPRVTKGMKDKAGYWFSNETLIERLDITPEEQRRLKTIISKAEANRREKEKKKAARRNENGLTARQQEKQDKINAVKALSAQGMKQAEIAESVGINKGTVSKILRGIY